ncbi:Dihydrofolate reductase [Evansella caseinilytica]|uniref:Dihydrofolate reductase n=1 Tax=Evansella caseinilytica TaxID=1503961 RepID=A0A1H3TPJ0_9BACI|nr:dihydrofolate reductase family protein [Evansella caseinilytica]SDZ51555.1 Dihydrofolate reductase [Evansella caseinilytica]
MSQNARFPDQRKVIYSQMVSLDGYIEGPNGEIDWGTPDRELFNFINELESDIDIHLYGRRTYENMANYWPAVERNPKSTEQEMEWAHKWVEIPKIVFSKTLDKVEWNARLIKDNISKEIAKLKAQPGKNCSLGGAALASTFIQLGLIDEYCLYIYPVALGRGKPLFPLLNARIHLQLIETRSFDSGVVFLRYHPNAERQ